MKRPSASVRFVPAPKNGVVTRILAAGLALRVYQAEPRESTQGAQPLVQRPTRLSDVLYKIIALEFVAIFLAASIAMGLYYWIVLGAQVSVSFCVPGALAIATLIVLVSIRFSPLRQNPISSEALVCESRDRRCRPCFLIISITAIFVEGRRPIFTRRLFISVRRRQHGNRRRTSHHV